MLANSPAPSNSSSFLFTLNGALASWSKRGFNRCGWFIQGKATGLWYEMHCTILSWRTRSFSGCTTRADSIADSIYSLFFCFLGLSLPYTNQTDTFCLGHFIWEIRWGQHVIYIAQWCYVSVPRDLSEFRNSWGFLSVSRNCQTSSWIRSCIQETCVLFGRFFYQDEI